MASSLPPLLAPLETDEYLGPPPGPRERRARFEFAGRATVSAKRLGWPLSRYVDGRMATAATLRAIDAATGGGFFDVPEEAEHDRAAADEAFAGEGPVLDVQTHYVAREHTRRAGMRGVLGFIREVDPERFAGLDPQTSLGFAEYLRCVYLESETAVAVLTATPGDLDHNILPNPEIAATREILDRCAGTGRMLHHAIVHPDVPGECDEVGAWAEAHRPAGLKVYTLHGSPGAPGGWRLDDQTTGLPFLETARRAGQQVVCAHKGLSGLAPTGSPSDVGPAARAFPDLQLLVYHSGYEVPRDESAEERAYDPEGGGTNRLVRSLADQGIGPGANVWAELGSTWACLVRRPVEAAHVLGKLLRAVGPERVLWGTDSVWYGPAQPLIDAFRAFRIPDRLQEAHGYPPLDDATKARILGANAACVYGIDLAAAARRRDDAWGWVADALAEARSRGLG